MVKNLSSNAGDVGSTPDQVIKISHNSGQLSPRTTTRDALVPLEESTCHNKDPVQLPPQKREKRREVNT